MTPAALINACRESGVLIQLDGDGLKLKGTTVAVRIAADRLRPHKAALVDHLKSHEIDDHQQNFGGASVRPAHEWLAMIKEMDALISAYCELFALGKNAKERILNSRYKQALASIPDSLDWFRREMKRQDL